MENICFVALGSNRKTLQYLIEAQRLLIEKFPDIRFSKILKTQPIDFCSPNCFYNRTAIFHTDQKEESVTCILKDIEKQIGRKPEDKSLGIVIIDLDLLVFNHIIKKPDDLNRFYIQEGIKELYPTLLR